MAKIEKTVFISYRRKDSYEALAVYQYLTGQQYDVFLDYTSIPSGDFAQIIVSNIKARAHFILILTPAALERCSEPGDWLRREIEVAIDEKRNIIPVFFEGFSYSTPGVKEKLTGKLEALPRYNGLTIPPGFFEEAMERLCEQYLSVPLDAVIHPVPSQVQKVVQDEQSAANQALEQKKEDIGNVVKPAEAIPAPVQPAPEVKTDPSAGEGGQEKAGSTRFNARLYGIGAGILLLLLLGIAGINSMVQNNRPVPTETPAATSTPRPTETLAPTEVVAGEPDVLEPTLTPSPTGTATSTPTPTLGVGSTLTSDKDGMTLLYVPSGEFTMGNPRGTGNSDENPAHKILLSAFWMDRTEVTNEMYRVCVNAGICSPPRPRTSKTRDNYFTSIEYDDYPVINVSWNDANTYCTWAGRRLPTEAEWEKAASWDEQNKQKLTYPWGDSIDCTLANYWGGAAGCNPDTTPAGRYPDGASPYGVLDLAGNVWEWVSDNYDSRYYESPGVYEDPQRIVATSNNHVIRGGSWYNFAEEVRAANRSQKNEEQRDTILGFRCVLPASE